MLAIVKCLALVYVENSGGYGTPVEAADPPHPGGSPDPGLTTLQPGNAPPYSMLPTFTHYATGRCFFFCK